MGCALNLKPSLTKKFHQQISLKVWEAPGTTLSTQRLHKSSPSHQASVFTVTQIVSKSFSFRIFLFIIFQSARHSTLYTLTDPEHRQIYKKINIPASDNCVIGYQDYSNLQPQHASECINKTQAYRHLVFGFRVWWFSLLCQFLPTSV